MRCAAPLAARQLLRRVQVGVRRLHRRLARRVGVCGLDHALCGGRSFGLVVLVVVTHRRAPAAHAAHALVAAVVALVAAALLALLRVTRGGQARERGR